jgi:hypothetical protein
MKQYDALQKFLDENTPEQLRKEIDSRMPLVCNINGKLRSVGSLPWYRKDKFGWPIETVKGKPIDNFIRFIIHGIIRKIV